MIAANDYIDPMLPRMSAVQLRTLIAQATGLLTHRVGHHDARLVLGRIMGALPDTPADLRTMKQIAEIVAARHGLAVRDLMGVCITRHHSRVRQEAMWEMRQIKCRDGRHKFSLPRIARFFGLMDHTSVIYGVRTHQARLDSPDVAA